MGPPDKPGDIRLRKARCARITWADGWGGRDRTFECWNQNPVPYHLATPQSSGQGRDHIEGAPAFQRGENAKIAGGMARNLAPFAWLRPPGGIAIRALPRDRPLGQSGMSESSSAW